MGGLEIFHFSRLGFFVDWPKKEKQIITLSNYIMSNRYTYKVWG